MIGDYNNNLNTQIGGQLPGKTSGSKTSENMYYNIFSKKMEVFELPDLDLEFNSVMIPEKSTFMRAT